MAGVLLALPSLACRDSTRNTLGGSEGRPVVSATEPPVGAETLAVQWVKMATPGSGAMIAAIARPEGTGPFPAVLILHGTHGFALEYVQLAQAMTRRGVVGVAACWFAGGRGAGSRFITPIACPDAPPPEGAELRGGPARRGQAGRGQVLRGRAPQRALREYDPAR